MALSTSFLKITQRNLRFLKVSGMLKACARNSSAAYDPDGKTVINILNNDETAPMMINGYSVLGFRLNNGLFVVGPVAIFPRSILSWNITDDRDINEKSLSLFLNLWPKLDVLIIGLSDPTDHKHVINTRKNVHSLIKNKGYSNLNFEVMPTEKAVTTFNFLNCENRYVGAALVPPTTYSPTLEDEFRTEYLSKKKDSMDVFSLKE